MAFLGINTFRQVSLCLFYNWNPKRVTKSGFMKPEIEPVTPGLQGIGFFPTLRRLDPWDSKKKLFMAVLGTNQSPLFGLRFVCWFYGGNTQRLTESGFMEKSGIEHATPGLQGIVLFLTPGEFDPWDSKKTFCGFPRYKPVLLCWFKICVLVLC